MKVILVSHSSTQSVITVKLPETDTLAETYEIHLFNDNGHTELHSRSFHFEEALRYHRFLCEKCNIRVNI